MRKFFQTGGHWFKTVLGSLPYHAFAVGMAAGAMLLEWCFQWSARLGHSLPVTSALGLAILMGIELGFRPLKSSYSSKLAHRAVFVCLTLLTVWTLAFSWLIEWQTQLLGAFSPLQLSQPWLALLLSLGFGIVVVTPAVAVAARLPFYLLADEQNSLSHRRLPATFLCGMASGVVFSAFVLSPVWGLLTTTITLAAFALAMTGYLFFRKTIAPTFLAELPPHSEDAPLLIPVSPIWMKSREVWTALVLLLLGGLFAWTFRVLDQLMPISAAMAAARWAFVALGLALGIAWNRRRLSTEFHRAGEVSAFFLAAYGVTLAASFPFWVQLCLSITVAIPNVLLLTLCRLGLVFVILAPLGLVWGRLSALLAKVPLQEATSAQTAPPEISLLAPAVVSGWLFAKWVLLSNVSMTQIAMGFSFAAAGLAVLRLGLTLSIPKRWASRLTLAGCTAALVFSSLHAGGYQPQKSAELLFAAPVFVARQSGVDHALLSELDEGRLVATHEGQQGTYTFWKYRGVQHQIRQNGLPKGMASGNTGLCPEYSAEVLPALMPLVLHERPDSVLILGLGSGVSLGTALAFPTQQVTCVETDPALIELLKDRVWNGQPQAVIDDPRLTILPLDPALMLRSKTELFDVIVSVPHQVMLAETATYFTEAFYRDASRNLAEQGLFCQRFTFVDFGPDALRIAARTMQNVFRDVVFLEMAGGEMLLLGTNSPDGVAREGFLARLQKRHVRNQLAALGWDWSVPLNLSAFPHVALQKFAAESSGPISSNRTTQGSLAFRLPSDMLRWGPKPYENQQALLAHVGRFAQWGGIDPEDPDLLRRLAEVTGQRNLMTNHPDEYWAYRKTVKDQVTQRPRSVIVQVKGEMPRQEIHEEDQRRLDYFRALGSAYQHDPPRAQDLTKVEMFAEHYDPLVTFFLHQELAELHSRCPDENYASELAHRIYSVYFAAPGDRSIRNVIAAIEILSQHPEAVQNPLDRWDYLNGLLQMVKQRWSIRAGVNPTSTSIPLNDVDKSLAAVDQALKAMDDMRNEAGVDPNDWAARRRFLEDTIVRPLRIYRRQLLPFHQRERIIQEKKQSAEED